jgi:diacylglycerol kinase (ATP)
MGESLLAIVNPAAGGGHCGELAPGALQRLRGGGLQIEEEWTRAPGHAQELARAAYQRGVRAFIAVGGDGTAHEIVNGLLPVALNAGASPRACLGFLPLGTGNSFLRDFGPDGLELGVSALQQGRRRPCDVLRLCHAPGELYSINLLSAGFVADVATTANRRFKALGTAGYILGVVLETAGLRASPFRMRLDSGPSWEGETTFVSFCNSRYTAGSMMMAPHADTDDGLVDVIVAKKMSRLRLLLAFPRIFSGGHVELPIISSMRARRVDFEGGAEIDLMIDGEVERHRPTRLDVLPRAIDVSV